MQCSREDWKLEKWKCSSVQWMKKSIYCFPWLLLHCAALIGCCDARNRESVGKWQPVKIEVEKGFMRSSQCLCGSVGEKIDKGCLAASTLCSGRYFFYFTSRSISSIETYLPASSIFSFERDICNLWYEEGECHDNTFENVTARKGTWSRRVTFQNNGIIF